MNHRCQCQEGYPYISSTKPGKTAGLLAEHVCSHCGELLFETELRAGLQLCATRDIRNYEGNYTLPKGRLVRLTGFVEKAGTVNLVFSGLLAVGSFQAEGFAAQWDIQLIVTD